MPIRIGNRLDTINRYYQTDHKEGLNTIYKNGINTTIIYSHWYSTSKFLLRNSAVSSVANIVIVHYKNSTKERNRQIRITLKNYYCLNCLKKEMREKKGKIWKFYIYWKKSSFDTSSRWWYLLVHRITTDRLSNFLVCGFPAAAFSFSTLDFWPHHQIFHLSHVTSYSLVL